MRDLVQENMIDIGLFASGLVARRNSGGVEFFNPRNLVSLLQKIASIFFLAGTGDYRNCSDIC